MKIKESKDRQIPVSCQRAEKAVEREDDGDTNCSWSPGNGPQRPGKETKDQRKNRDHSDHGTIKISQNTSNSAGDLRSLAVTQKKKKHTLLKTSVKTSERIKIIVHAFITFSAT